MAFTDNVGRRTIVFTHHALDRWWERCRENEIHGRNAALDLLRERIKTARWSQSLPAWSRLSLWSRARAEGFIYIADNEGFVVNKDNDGRRVAVTYIDEIAMLHKRVA